MAKRKDLLLNESVTRRMMGLAGIGALTNPFLREGHKNFNPDNPNSDPFDASVDQEGFHSSYGDDEFPSEESGGEYGDEGENLDSEFDLGNEECPECGQTFRSCECPSEDNEMDEEMEYEMDEEMDDEMDEEMDDEMDEEMDDEMDESAPQMSFQENLRRSMKKLKKLLEQAEMPGPKGGEAEDMEPAPEMPEETAGDETESKIKDFVRKLGELVQETLGVEVTVEDGHEEPDGDEGMPVDDEEAPMPPAPMEEAINRLVNKITARVKRRLIEAKKKAPAGRAAMLKEKQAAQKKKAEADKKKMEMKKAEADKKKMGMKKAEADKKKVPVKKK